eukprot:6195201-Pleurochrysis_carterae.AAC.1
MPRKADARQGEGMAARSLSPVSVLSTLRDFAPSWTPPASSGERSFALGFDRLAAATAAGGVCPNALADSPPFRRALFSVRTRYLHAARPCDTP